MNRVYRVVWNSSQGLWSVASELAGGAGKSKTKACVVAAALLGLAGSAAAACTVGGNPIVCSATGTQTTIVGAGPGTSFAQVLDVQTGALISTGITTAVSLSDNATISIGNGAVVENSADNTGAGLWNSGANTIEFQSGTHLTIAQGGSVIAHGSEGTAEAINAMGTDNVIVNHGLIRSQGGGAAIWFQPSSGSNTVFNGPTGTIEHQGGAGNIIGMAAGTMAITFTNQGQLIGSLNFTGGDDTLNLHTGSSITGSVNGGAGNNLLTLNGTGTGSFARPISNFQTLVKNDAGTWTFGSALQGAGITSTQVAGGTLILDADASNYTGSMTVDAAGTLQTSAEFAPLAITDNGLVRFAQIDDVSYAGLLSGAGGIEKTGAGTLTLTRDQATTGLTTITAGTLQLGDAGPTSTTGSVAGDIANNAALVLNRSNALVLAGTISGTGSVTQLGGGTTTFIADNSYTGGTTITAGTLQLGNGGTTGGVVGDIVNNATLAVNRSNTLNLAGAISGSGALRQMGVGTTVLSGANTYGGATTVAAGTLKAAAIDTFSANSAHTVAVGATLDTAGFSQRVAALRNAGTVSLLGTAAGSTLTITGAYVGDNGVLKLGTVLGGNASLSDRLVLSGSGASASGHTTLQITNLGGLGAQTSGSGIEVVSAVNGATTTAQTSRDAFALANGHVDAGAFEYRLHAADAQGAGESWYLRSETTVAPPTAAPPTAAPPTVA
ncbi:MAG: autotransporter outer membrane beta-barrel domain-containing protein, partial [Variovorax sp.]